MTHPSPTTRWGLVALALVSTAALGASVALAASGALAPASTAPAETVERVEVTVRPYLDPRPVQLVVESGGPRALTSTVDGVVTRSTCVPGEPLRSGSTPVSVNGIPLVSLATEVPLWRDLESGARGTDVDALREELTRLGHDVSADGNRLGPRTRTALNALLRQVGAPALEGRTVPRNRFLWLPAAEAPVLTCSATVGQAIATGTALAEFPPSLTSAKIMAIPAPVAPGPRVVALDGVTLPVADGGQITDPQALASLAATPSYAVHVADSNGTPLRGSYQLVDPVNVAVVPPSAIAGAAGSTCVVGDAGPVPVEVIGSELGQSYIIFRGTPPASVATSPDRETACG